MIAMDQASRSTHILAAPQLASTAAPAASHSSGTGGQPASPAPVSPAPVSPAPVSSAPVSPAPVPPLGPVNPGTSRADAESLMPGFGWSPGKYFGCLDNLWSRESGWRYDAANPSGAFGIPQALPGSKMASAGPDWQTNPVTQIKWGLGYIQGRYGDPCSAWSYWEANGSY